MPPLNAAFSRRTFLGGVGASGRRPTVAHTAASALLPPAPLAVNALIRGADALAALEATLAAVLAPRPAGHLDGAAPWRREARLYEGGSTGELGPGRASAPRKQRQQGARVRTSAKRSPGAFIRPGAGSSNAPARLFFQLLGNCGGNKPGRPPPHSHALASRQPKGLRRRSAACDPDCQRPGTGVSCAPHHGRTLLFNRPRGRLCHFAPALGRNRPGYTDLYQFARTRRG